MAHVDLSKLFDKDALSDLEIVFGNESIKCHRSILYCASEYFEKLLGESRFKVRPSCQSCSDNMLISPRRAVRDKSL